MDFIKNLILIISYQVIYILFANTSNGAINIRTASPNSIPIIPVKKVESSTIIDKIIFRENNIRQIANVKPPEPRRPSGRDWKSPRISVEREGHARR